MAARGDTAQNPTVCRRDSAPSCLVVMMSGTTAACILAEHDDSRASHHHARVACERLARLASPRPIHAWPFISAMTAYLVHRVDLEEAIHRSHGVLLSQVARPRSSQLNSSAAVGIAPAALGGAASRCRFIQVVALPKISQKRALSVRWVWWAPLPPASAPVIGPTASGFLIDFGAGARCSSTARCRRWLWCCRSRAVRRGEARSVARGLTCLRGCCTRLASCGIMLGGTTVMESTLRLILW